MRGTKDQQIRERGMIVLPFISGSALIFSFIVTENDKLSFYSIKDVQIRFTLNYLVASI